MIVPHVLGINVDTFKNSIKNNFKNTSKNTSKNTVKKPDSSSKKYVRETISKMMSGLLKSHGVIPNAVAALDNALWDLFAKIENIPLFELIRNETDQNQADRNLVVRNSLKEYASLPFLGKLNENTVEKWDFLMNSVKTQGYKFIKFHGHGNIEGDEKLVSRFCGDSSIDFKYMKFMIDVEGEYKNVDDAKRLATICSETGRFIWLESIVPDYNFDQWNDIRESSPNLEFIPGGNYFLDSETVKIVLNHNSNCWKRYRFDAGIAFGISNAIEISEIMLDFDKKSKKSSTKKIELQTWAHALNQALGIHVMLGLDNGGEYFERPIVSENGEKT